MLPSIRWIFLPSSFRPLATRPLVLLSFVILAQCSLVPSSPVSLSVCLSSAGPCNCWSLHPLVPLYVASHMIVYCHFVPCLLVGCSLVPIVSHPLLSRHFCLLPTYRPHARPLLPLSPHQHTPLSPCLLVSSSIFSLISLSSYTLFPLHLTLGPFISYPLARPLSLALWTAPLVIVLSAPHTHTSHHFY